MTKKQIYEYAIHCLDNAAHFLNQGSYLHCFEWCSMALGAAEVLGGAEGEKIREFIETYNCKFERAEDGLWRAFSKRSAYDMLRDLEVLKNETCD